jgi:uncharacterized membrane protein YgcG
MNCPRCVREIPYAALTCGECGFSLFDQDAQFGSDAVSLERVNNKAGQLSEEEVASIEQALDGFERAFPQLFLAVYSVALPVMASVRQFGFWLLNRAGINGVEITRPNENGALLIIDETSGQAGLVVGYLLECYFPEPELAEILEAARKDWSAGRMAAGVLAIIAEFSKALKKKSKIALQHPARFRPPTTTVPSKPEFHRLHESNQGSVEETTVAQDAPAESEPTGPDPAANSRMTMRLKFKRRSK